MTARDPYVTGANRITNGAWRIEQQNDPITGKPISNAYVVGRSSNANVDFAEPVLLSLSCFNGDPLARFKFAFRVGSTQNASFAYRFDDKPGREIEARFLFHDKSVVIEDRAAVIHFLDELVSSKRLFVRIRALNAGRSVAEFQVDGARAAADAALGDCLDKNERQRLRANA